MDYRIEDSFETSVEAYWEMFFSEDYTKGLFAHLDIALETISFERQGEGQTLRIDRVQRLTPKREVPALVKKLVSGAIAYKETNHFRADTSEMEVITEPNYAADRLETRGVYAVKPDGAGRVVRVFDGVVNAKIPLIGGKIEKHLVAEVRESYARATDFTRDYIRKAAG